jgi:hypothetical protein
MSDDAVGEAFERFITTLIPISVLTINTIATVGLTVALGIFLVLAIWVLRKTHAHQIYLIWLSFSFFFVMALLVCLYVGQLSDFNPALQAVVHEMINADSEYKMVAGIIGLIVGPQVLTYFLAGLSGSASTPLFVSQITNFMIWNVVKFLSASSGILLALVIWNGEMGVPATLRHQFEHQFEFERPFAVILPILLPLSMAFVLAMSRVMYPVMYREWIDSASQKKVFSRFRRVHEFFTRYSRPI